MPTTLRFEITSESREMLKRVLDPRQYKQALFQIVNRTTVRVAKIIQDKIRDESTINAKYVKRVITTIRPKGDPPEGHIIVRKESIPLIAFQTKGSKRGGVRITISKSLPPIVLKHGFLATMKSGHRGVFMRAQRSATRLRFSKIGHTMRAVTPAGIAERLPIEERFGPSVYKIVSVPRVIQNIDFDARAYMEQQAKSQIARFAARKPITDEASK